MKISYNWLKQYINIALPAEETAKLLTNCGLEVESVEKHESVKGGLKGMVIGEVLTKEKHPDADRLSVTAVNIGTGPALNIVCGASNVAAGQKVVVATIGATLYPSTGEPFEIKKSKIRGALSEGMICAEDEIGLGASHEGILILDPSAKVGAPAAEYFKLESNHVFEIGLTPNRADAASHVGVARDLVAVLSAGLEPDQNINSSNDPTYKPELRLPNVSMFRHDNTHSKTEVIVEDADACPRYSGISINGVTVKESPNWLKNFLGAIGLKPINNIVDITNFVMHELGQPLHAFDADKITGKKVIVKKLPAKTKFTTLDGIERELNGTELMICNAEEGMCIAGVFGGNKSGISNTTTNIFLESAYFNSGEVRKASKHHGLKTDSSFRFERGTDPNMTVFALKRAALLIKELAGGELSSDIIDIYPKKIENFKIGFSYGNCFSLIGKEIDKSIIKNILTALDIEIVNEGADGLMLSVPPFKVDVTREVDVIEEILRVYGYNQIEIPNAVRSTLSWSSKPDPEKLQNAVSDLLSGKGFHEIITNSLTKSDYTKDLSQIKPEEYVQLLNPLSSDLNVMRQTLLFNGLESIAYNINRKNSDLKLYEFGKNYSLSKGKYNESTFLSLFITGNKVPETWNNKTEETSFYSLKGYVDAIVARLGIDKIQHSPVSADNELLINGLTYTVNKTILIQLGQIKKSVLKQFDFKQDIFYAELNWDIAIDQVKRTNIQYKEVSKFQEVRRDLALLIDKTVSYEQLKQIAYQTEKQLLRNVNIFDVYEGDKLEEGKKSYALSFTLLNENETLTDKQVEKVMERLVTAYSEKAGAKVR